jgi:SAM-dependent methyltransferase
MDLLDQYAGSLSHAEQERLRYLLEDLRFLASSPEPFRFLDLGAGSGSMSLGLLLLLPHSVGTLVDVQDRFAIPEEISRQVAGRYRCLPWKQVEEIAAEQFDLVLSTDVLEHIPNWRAAFRKLATYVQAGGYLYVQVPSNYPSPNWPRAELLRQRLLGTIKRNDPNQHVRHGLSCKAIFDEAQSLGLKPLIAAEDYVVGGRVFCDFKPRCHCLFQR